MKKTTFKSRSLGFFTSRALASCAALAAAFGLARSARAAEALSLDRSVNVDLFEAAIGPKSFLSVDAPEVLDHKRTSYGLLFDYQRRPFALYTQDEMGKTLSTSYPVDNQVRAQLWGAIGLLDRFQIGLALPVSLYLSGQNVSTMTGESDGSTYSSAGLGDLRLEGKGQILTAGSDDQFVLGALLGLTAPTSGGSDFRGEDGFTGRLKALASLQLGRVRLGGNVGGILRKKSTVLSTPVGNQLVYGAAGSVDLVPGVAVLAEVAGRSGFDAFSTFYKDENPVEVDAAGRFEITKMVAMTVGVGSGLGHGVGSPQMRLFAGAVFTPDFRDADQDGVYDVEDKCPDQPEDRDGFHDNDGCPDPDNDGDGLADAQDKCPNDAEDFDQFQDEDGCPEPDNDKDGIPDLNDACPNAAEDGRGKRPKDGCPSTSEDSDGDGVPDTVDKCPDEPEDRDGFQDDDGCPDPDNDNDGIPDNFDNCPNDAEDQDGVEDEDGCPDLDNDHDGIPDTKDKCPAKPETLNGVQDDDGCPDPGPEIVKLGADRIEVVDPRLAFVVRGGKVEVAPASAKVVHAIGLVMLGHADIAQLRIQVNAETGGQEMGQKRAEAIRAALLKQGVEPGRVVASGVVSGPKLELVIEHTATKATPGAGQGGDAAGQAPGHKP